MAHQIPLDDVDPGTIDSSFADVGSYHFQVIDVGEETISETSGNASLPLTLEVLAGLPKGQEGRTHRTFLTFSAGAAKRNLKFAIALGLTTIDELDALKKAGKSPEIDFKLAAGRQFKARLEEEEYNGKVRPKIQFDVYHLNDPKAKDIPVNEGKLAAMGAADAPFDAGSGGGDDDPFA